MMSMSFDEKQQEKFSPDNYCYYYFCDDLVTGAWWFQLQEVNEPGH